MKALRFFELTHFNGNPFSFKQIHLMVAQFKLKHLNNIELDGRKNLCGSNRKPKLYFIKLKWGFFIFQSRSSSEHRQSKKSLTPLKNENELCKNSTAFHSLIRKMSTFKPLLIFPVRSLTLNTVKNKYWNGIFPYFSKRVNFPVRIIFFSSVLCDYSEADIGWELIRKNEG